MRHIFLLVFLFFSSANWGCQCFEHDVIVQKIFSYLSIHDICKVMEIETLKRHLPSFIRAMKDWNTERINEALNWQNFGILERILIENIEETSIAKINDENYDTPKPMKLFVVTYAHARLMGRLFYHSTIPAEFNKTAADSDVARSASRDSTLWAATNGVVYYLPQDGFWKGAGIPCHEGEIFKRTENLMNEKVEAILKEKLYTDEFRKGLLNPWIDCGEACWKLSYLYGLAFHAQSLEVDQVFTQIYTRVIENIGRINDKNQMTYESFRAMATKHIKPEDISNPHVASLKRIMELPIVRGMPALGDDHQKANPFLKHLGVTAQVVSGKIAV